MRLASCPGRSYHASGGSSCSVGAVGLAVLSSGCLAMSGLVFFDAERTAFKNVLSPILLDLDTVGVTVGVVGSVPVLGRLKLGHRLWSGGSDT